MGYEPIKVIAWAETDLNGHVNRVTKFDETSQSNKLSYRDGFPHITCVPNGQNTRGPRLVDYNGLFYLFSSNLFELQQGNYPTYNAAIVGTGKPLPNGYPQGTVLWYAAGGYFVKSLVSNNTESDLSNTNNWAKITVSAADLASGLSSKVDLASGVAQADVDYVVESYINGSSWYRVYKSGWCEQGGIQTENTEVVFLKPFADTDYGVSGICDFIGTNSFVSFDTKTSTGIIFRVGTDAAGTVPVTWRAWGYMAQGE